MWILLKRFSYPCCLSDMAPRFKRNPTEICLMFNYVLDSICNRFNYLPSSLNQNILQSTAKLLWVCWWSSFTDFLPKEKSINQNIVHNGYKGVHSFTFQYLDSSLVILVAPMNEIGMRVPWYRSLGCYQIN